MYKVEAKYISLLPAVIIYNNMHFVLYYWIPVEVSVYSIILQAIYYASLC